MIDIRIAHLEERIDRFETKIDALIDRVGSIATRSETRNFLLIGIGTFVAIVTLFIGGMGWLETRASRLDARSAPAQQPIVIQMPTPAPAASPQAKEAQ